MEQRSCLDCFNCKCRVILKLISPTSGRRRWRHSNPIVADKLNSRLIFTEIYCAEGEWIKQDGTEFRYASLRGLKNNPVQERLKLATHCNRYSP